MTRSDVITCVTCIPIIIGAFFFEGCVIKQGYADHITALEYTVTEKDEQITSYGAVIAAQKKVIEKWENDYNQLRWQLRTTPPKPIKKGIG
jgi:uncharacterized coiled-coil protein SlyX